MSEWISVEERLPLKQRGGCSEVVDVWIENERWPNCYYYFEEEEWYDVDTGDAISHKVTHWMKIPSPPEV
jgi:hypothetical protein